MDGRDRDDGRPARRQRYCEMCDRWVPATERACRLCGSPTRAAVVTADRTEIVAPETCTHPAVECRVCGQVIVKTPDQVR